MADALEILDCPMGKNDAGADTVREYFCRLLLKVWEDEEEFDGKRPFGNSGWQSDVRGALMDAGLLDDPESWGEAEEKIWDAIKEMCR